VCGRGGCFNLFCNLWCVCVCVCMFGFCNARVCVWGGVCNVRVCACVGFVICGVCMCGFCNVCVCMCVVCVCVCVCVWGGVVMCGYAHMWVL